MSEIRGSCCHKIDEKWLKSGKYNIIIKYYDEKGDRSLCSVVVCKKCYPKYKKHIIKSFRDGNKWLKGKKDEH